jgi:hypothetical protein
MTNWYILCSFGTFFHFFGIMYQEKSGNPVLDRVGSGKASNIASFCGIVLRSRLQGCQMVHFQTKYPNFGIFWKALEWKILVYFMDIWYF